MIINPFIFGSAPPPSSGSPFITAITPGSLRNDFSSFVGFAFQVGGADITITDLGRWVYSGNSQSHTIKITNGSYTTLCSASLNTSGQTAGQFAYVSCTPTVLTIGNTYYLLAEEFNGGDQWSNDDCSGLTHTSDANITFSVYYLGSLTTNNSDQSYVPVNLKYTV